MTFDTVGADSPVTAQHRSRWGIRVLLIVVTACVIACGLVARERWQCSRGQALLDAATESPGLVFYEGTNWRLPENSTRPEWLKWFLGDDSYRFVRGINYTRNPFFDDIFPELHRLPKLKELSITGIANSDLPQLRSLPKVTELCIRDGKVTDAGLEHLKPLTHLESLFIMDTNIGDAGMVHLKGLTNLQTSTLR